MPPPLDEMLARDVIAYLGIDPALSGLPGLDALIDAYTRRVPWESASRIARRAQTSRTEDCPRWPETFWPETLAQGVGGTCYESNLALFSLLRYLGYEGYLTINDMNELIGCHAAIVVQLGENRLLVDAGLPVHVPLPLDSSHLTTRTSAFHTYSATPEPGRRFRIERDRHPKPYCFHLNDTPIPLADYRAITTQDYALPEGQFLDRVIVVKVVEGQIWRFSSADAGPYHLETFVNGGKTYYHLGDDPAVAAGKIAARFSIDPAVVSAALAAIPRAR